MPIFSSAGLDKDDVFIRAYNNCPAFNDLLARWYTQPSFVAMSQVYVCDHVLLPPCSSVLGLYALLSLGAQPHAGDRQLAVD